MVNALEPESEYASGSPFPPLAATGAPTLVPPGEFSATARLAGSSSSAGCTVTGNRSTGCASVAPEPLSDQSLSPSALRASTCTS